MSKISYHFQIVPASCERSLKLFYRQTFHRFQILPTSCERSLNLDHTNLDSIIGLKLHVMFLKNTESKALQKAVFQNCSTIELATST